MITILAILVATLCLVASIRAAGWYAKQDNEDAEDTLVHVCQRLDLDDNAAIEEIDEALDRLIDRRTEATAE